MDFGYDGGFGGGDFGADGGFGGGDDFGGGGGFGDGGAGGGGGGGGGGFGGGDFGGNAAGGFVESGSQSSSPAQKSGGGNCVTTCTIAQILNAEQKAGNADGAYEIDGTSAKHICFAAEIVDVEVKTSHVVLSLEDGTGSVNARKFIDGDDSGDGTTVDPVKGLNKGDWIRCHASIKAFNNAKQIQVLGFVPIKSIDAITHHYLQAMYEHCRKTKGPLPRTDGTSAANAAKPDSFNSPGGVLQGQRQAIVADAQSSLADSIMKFVKERGDSEMGCSQEAIIGELTKGGADKGQIVNKIQDLCDEGMLYSTIDDFHFQTTA